MAGKTLIGGTAYTITGGKNLIGGTAYSILNGKTLVGGTVYTIGFGTDWDNPRILTPKNGTTQLVFKETPIFYNGYHYGLSGGRSSYNTGTLQVSTGLESFTNRGSLGYSNGLHICNGKLMSRTSVRPVDSGENTQHIYYATPNGTSTTMSSMSFQILSASYRDDGYEAIPTNFVYYNGSYYCLFERVYSGYSEYLAPGTVDGSLTTWSDAVPVSMVGECSDDYFHGLYLGSDRIFYLQYDDSASSGQSGFVRWKLLSDISSWDAGSGWSFKKFTSLDLPLCMWSSNGTYYIAGTRYMNATGNRITIATSTDGSTWNEAYISNTLNTYSSYYGTSTSYATANYVNGKLIIAIGDYGQADDTKGIDLYISDDLSTVEYHHVDTPAGHTIPGTVQFDGSSYYLTATFQSTSSCIVAF